MWRPDAELYQGDFSKFLRFLEIKLKIASRPRTTLELSTFLNRSSSATWLVNWTPSTDTVMWSTTNGLMFTIQKLKPSPVIGHTVCGIYICGNVCHKQVLRAGTSNYVPWYLLDVITCSYTLGREYRVMRNRYSRLLFTSEDRLCANLRVQEQSTNMTSQC